VAHAGTEKWFSDEKSYGFILPDEGGEELFVHYTDVEGERVVYEVAPRGARGPPATNVRKSG